MRIYKKRSFSPEVGEYTIKVTELLSSLSLTLSKSGVHKGHLPLNSMKVEIVVSKATKL